MCSEAVHARRLNLRGTEKLEVEKCVREQGDRQEKWRWLSYLKQGVVGMCHRMAKLSRDVALNTVSKKACNVCTWRYGMAALCSRKQAAGSRRGMSGGKEAFE